MSKIGFAAILLLIMGKSYSQENYFVLIQADNSQPFYAMMGGRTFSSSSMGHLILPRLKDSTYLVTIGFPKGLFPDQQFSITVNKADHRFQLKKSGETGWGLFDPQTTESMMPVKKDPVENNMALEGVKKDDAFSRLMAGVVNDTAVMYTDPIPGQQQTGEPGMGSGAGRPGGASRVEPGVRPETEPDSPITALVPVVKDSSDSGAPGKRGEPKTEKDGLPGRDMVPFIEKISEQRIDWSVKLVFVDHDKEGLKDTILVQIPVDSLPLPAVGKSVRDTFLNGGRPNVARGPSARLGDSVPGPAFKGEPDPSYHSAHLTDSSASPGSVHGRGSSPLSPAAKNNKLILVNSDCRDFASAEDVDKLRIKMMNAVSDRSRIELATRVFRNKCFTSGQIKALNELFMNDEGRFGFFEAAYPFVTDSDRFKDLVKLLTDPRVVDRFKKMTGQQ